MQHKKTLKLKMTKELNYNFMPSYNQNKVKYMQRMLPNTQLPEQSQVHREQTANGESGVDINELREADLMISRGKQILMISRVKQKTFGPPAQHQIVRLQILFVLLNFFK